MIRLKYLSKRAVLLYALLMSIGSQASPTLHTEAFVHPGLLQTREDFTRIREKLANYNQPWLAGWQKLIATPHASLARQPNPMPVEYPTSGGPKNDSDLSNDAAAAYALALRWQISNNPAYADKAVSILNQWALTLTAIKDKPGRALVAGLYG